MCLKMPSVWARLLVALGLGLGPSGKVLAQRTADNAATAAEDAFGTTVGLESIGIYDSGNVRGFSPTAAGNVRIEGLYFDQQGGVTSRINDGSTVHVGPSTQGFAFPAPTGVVDLTLRDSGEKFALSPLFSASSFGDFGAEADGQIGLASGLSTSIGAGFYENHYGNGGRSTRWNIGLVPRWQLSDRVELTGFFSREQTYGDTSQPIYIPDGDFLPDRIVRRRYPGPRFLRNDYYGQSFGALGKVERGNWVLQAGLFRSGMVNQIAYSNVISIASDRQTTSRFADAFPPSATQSWSGELRAFGTWREGPRQHRIILSLRGRSLRSRYGDGEEIALGSADLNAVIDQRKPSFTFGALTQDRTDQISGGIAYNLTWPGVVELTFGAQRNHYIKAVAAPDLPVARGVTDIWLPSFSATVPVTPAIAVYASYVRGLEDSGVAPNFAFNANAILPANRTRQFDLGIKVGVAEKATVIFGYFDIVKPYLDLNVAGVFGTLGQQRNRGFELSVTANPSPELTIVAGGVFARPRVSPDPSSAEPIGSRSIGQPDTRAQINVNYQLPFAPKWTLDAYVDAESSSVGTISNSIVIPGSVRFGGGVRYSFSINKKPAVLRLSVYNISNVYRLSALGSGAYQYNDPISVFGYVTADF